MRRRGRPPHPEILTPREFEVLELLRQGLSNREISERLGISLGGAKYHITEILSKLGVETREEAAAWSPRSTRRWGLLPLTAQSWWAGLALAPKLASVAAVLAVSGLAALALGAATSDPGTAAQARTPAEATPTAERCQRPSCGTVMILRTPLSSFEAAGGVASFEVIRPGYIPAGFEAESLVHTRPDFAPDMAGNYDMLWASYEDPAGGRLAIYQGWYGLPNIGYEYAPDAMRGKADLGEATAYWVRGTFKTPPPGTIPNEPRDWEDGGYRLSWISGQRQVTGWEIRPGNSEPEFTGLRMQYVIVTDMLPLDELVRIARSMQPQ